MASRFRNAVVAALLMIAAAGCGTQESEPPAVVEVLQDQQYYYACGNEILRLADGRKFYPLLRGDQRAFDDSRYNAALAAPVGHRPAVAPPGPGDDTGTLTIYDDGMAHWVSDSGVEAWLTEEPIEYNWLC